MGTNLWIPTQPPTWKAKPGSCTTDIRKPKASRTSIWFRRRARWSRSAIPKSRAEPAGMRAISPSVPRTGSMGTVLVRRMHHCRAWLASCIGISAPAPAFARLNLVQDVKAAEIQNSSAFWPHRQDIGEALVPVDVVRDVRMARVNLFAIRLVGAAQQNNDLRLLRNQRFARRTMQRTVLCDRMHHRP